MYEKRFGLEQAPFEPEAKPEFFVEGEPQRRALAHLQYGIKQGEGIVIITGDEGVGKSTLIDTLIRTYTKQSHRLVLVSALEGNLEGAILNALPKVETLDGEQVSFADKLRDLRDSGISVTVLIDDAEGLDDEGLAQVRRLSNLFHDGEALLQLSLIGDTPLRSVLYSADMQKLRQRIIASYHLPPMDETETRSYLAQRLAAAGGMREGIFSNDAVAVLHAQTKGRIDAVNTRATAALYYAAQAGRTQVEAEDVMSSADLDVSALEPLVDDIEPPRAASTAEDFAAIASPVGRQGIEPNGVRIRHRFEESEAPKPAMPMVATPNRASVSVGEINAAIENMQRQSPDAPAQATSQPQPTEEPRRPARRVVSPMELMFRGDQKQQTEPSAPAQEMSAPRKRIALPPAPAPVSSDVWADATAMSGEERERLDRIPFDVQLTDNTEMQEMVSSYLAETRTALTKLREAIQVLREEAQQLDDRRRKSREMISMRLVAAQERLDALRVE